WLGTHYLLRESTVWRAWRDDEVVALQRHADYAYRMATDAPAAKEVRLFGLAGWVVDRFGARPPALLPITAQALPLPPPPLPRPRRPLPWPRRVCAAGHALLPGAIAHAAIAGRLSLPPLTIYAGAAIGTAVLGVAEFDWWFHTAARPGPVVDSLAERMPAHGHL